MVADRELWQDTPLSTQSNESPKMSGNLLKSTSIVSLMTFASRILGFVRDMVCAQIFGASLGFDVFLLAFKIPNFLRRLFAEGAFSQAFVPILSEYKSTREQQEVQTLIHKVSGCLTVVLTLVTIFGILAAPFFVLVFAPGFIGDAARFDMAVEMLRITFPYLLFISLTALAGGVFNTYQKFALPAFTPVLLNLSLIFFAILVSPYFEKPVVALAWGVFFGGLIQLGLQVPFLGRHGFLPKMKVDWQDEGVRRILKLMTPALIGASVMQINLLVDTIFASFLPVGSLSWLYFSDRLLELPIGMFGVALATVTLPNLSTSFAKGNDALFRNHLSWALKWCLLIGIPCTLGLCILAEPILTTLFHRGAFVARDVVMSAKSLRTLTFGLTAFMMVKILISAFYARHNTRFPMKVAVVALLSNAVLNACFIGPLQHAGLTLASSISAFVQLGLLSWVLWREGWVRLEGGLRFTGQTLFANGLMGGLLFSFTPKLDVWLDYTASYRAMMLLSLILGAVVLYMGSLWLLGLRPRHLIAERA